MVSSYTKKIKNKIKRIKFNSQSRFFIISVAIAIFVLGFILGKITSVSKQEGSIQIPIIQNQSLIPVQIEQQGAIITTAPVAQQIQQPQGALITTKPIAAQQVQAPVASVVAQPATSASGTPVVATAPAVSQKTISVSIRSSDSLEKIFKRNGIDTKSASAILGLKQASLLNNLHAGKKLSLKIEKIIKPALVPVALPPAKSASSKNKNKKKDKTKKIKNTNQASYKLIELVYIADELNAITVTAHGNSWQVKLKHIEPTVKLSYVSAIIDGSVYSAASKKGISRKVVAQLSSMFNKKADIGKMRKGDRFALCCKEYFIGNKKIKDGEVLAAEIMHNGKLQRMVSFTDPKGNKDYYTPEGYNSNPPFIRIPVSYKNIGSRFGMRTHPILGYTRMHKGVDFSASHGTPVQAACSGVVEFAGRSGGHGLMITLKKGAYSALYAHLSKLAGHVRSGSYVKKGETIGYVGATGLATGSHLHYEIHVNGVHRDPLTVKLPEGEMIAAEYRKSFFTQARKALAQLDMHRNSSSHMVAMNDSDDKLA